MRQLIINSFDILVWVFGGFIMLTAMIAGIGAMVQRQALVGLAFIVGGAIYAVLMMGVFFIAIGIYQNTKRTAEAVAGMTFR